MRGRAISLQEVTIATIENRTQETRHRQKDVIGEKCWISATGCRYVLCKVIGVSQLVKYSPYYTLPIKLLVVALPSNHYVLSPVLLLPPTAAAVDMPAHTSVHTSCLAPADGLQHRYEQQLQSQQSLSSGLAA